MSALVTGETKSFKVRAAKTVRRGPRRPGVERPQAGTPAPLPGQSFQVREATTVVLPPPHWAQLSQSNPETAVKKPQAGSTGETPVPQDARPTKEE